jgi:hypothetical protein
LGQREYVALHTVHTVQSDELKFAQFRAAKSEEHSDKRQTYESRM